jgi:hypothetical protein
VCNFSCVGPNLAAACLLKANKTGSWNIDGNWLVVFVWEEVGLLRSWLDLLAAWGTGMGLPGVRDNGLVECCRSDGIEEVGCEEGDNDVDREES